MITDYVRTIVLPDSIAGYVSQPVYGMKIGISRRPIINDWIIIISTTSTGNYKTIYPTITEGEIGGFTMQ